MKLLGQSVLWDNLGNLINLQNDKVFLATKDLWKE